MTNILQKAPNINLAKLEVGKTYEFHLRDGRVLQSNLTGLPTLTCYPYELRTDFKGFDHFEAYLQNGHYLTTEQQSVHDIIEITEVTP